FVSSSLNARFVRAFGRRYALVLTLLVAAYGTALLHFQQQSGTSVFILYLWSGLLGTVMVIQFWMFAGQLLTIAQGKRLFGPIAAGGVLGAVTGASTAAVLLAYVEVEALLLVAAGIFVATAVLLTTVVADEAVPRPSPTPEGAIPEGAPRLGFRALFRDEPYLMRIAALVAISTVAVLVTDYLFKSVAASTYHGNELGTFFARYYAALNALSLFVQVVVAGRLIRRQGVIVAMTVLPALLLAGSAGIVAAGGLFSLVLLTKGSDGALRHSLHRVSSELLWMPIASEIRDRGKALIDGVLARATQAATAGLIMIATMMGPASPRLLAGAVMVASIAWIAITMSLRKPYLDLFRQALRRGTLEGESVPDELDLASVEAILESLSSREPARVVAAMDLLAERGRTRLIPGLVLYHESDEVLVHALELFTASGRDDWYALGERLLTHDAEPVRTAAVRAFALRHRADLLDSVLRDPSPSVRAHAVFHLAHADPDRDPREDPRLAELMALEGSAGRAAQLALLQAIRDRGDPRWAGVVLKMLDAEDAHVVEAAALTMEKVRDERFIPILLKRLATRDGRGAIRNALVALGAPALDALTKTLRDPDADPRVRLHVPRTISRFGTQRAADVLVEELAAEHTGMLRYKILRGLGRLAADHDVKLDHGRIDAELTKSLVEHLRLGAIAVGLRRERERLEAARGPSGTLLVELVDEKAAEALERAFRLLQLVHPYEDLRSIHLALSSGDRRTRASAQEFLDVLTSSADLNAVGERDRRELLAIVSDDLAPAERAARAAHFLPPMPSSYAAILSLLVREADEDLASIAGYHALELGADSLRDEVIAVYEERPSLRSLLSRPVAIPRAALGAAHG
ncbi:hypothetical protein L6R52_31875, partial [Myxococcota bacterium]|nr:hypothetical protein [Myxococcota bacterium]